MELQGEQDACQPQASKEEPLWLQSGLLGWTQCRRCKISVLIKEAKDKGCPQCKNIYTCSPENQQKDEPPPHQHQQRKIKTEEDVEALFADPSEILEGQLYLGSECSARKETVLKDKGVKFILNVTQTVPNEFPHIFTYLSVRIDDLPSQNISQHFETATSFIHQAIDTEKTAVLVHCAAGVSRSATIVLAYLMKYHRKSLREAFLYTKKRRPAIGPNRGFMEQLMTYERELFGGENSLTWQDYFELL